MAQTWESFYASQEAEAMGRYKAKVEQAIKDNTDFRHKNRNCWPLASFGGKDADLDPEGCCGIKEITAISEDSVTVRVGGHKTVGVPEEASLKDEAQELVCGTWTPKIPNMSGDCDGEEWTLFFHEDITVPTPWDDSKTEEENLDAIGKAVVDAAEKACQPFQEEMVLLDEAMNRLGER